MYNLVMRTRLNNFLLECLEQILIPMGDQQIRLIQNWLIALSRALFALRSKGRKVPLLTSEEEAYEHLKTLDEDMNICTSEYGNPLRVHINVPLLPKTFPSQDTDRTTIYRFPFNDQEKSQFIIKQVGIASVNRREAKSTTSGINIVNFFDDNAFKKD